MCEQKRTAQNSDESTYYLSVPTPQEFAEAAKDYDGNSYDGWVQDLCLDDLTPEEFAALGRQLDGNTRKEHDDDNAE